MRWMAARAGEGHVLTFEVPKGEGIRGARYVARMTTAAHGVLGGEGARSPAAALLALVEELREYETKGRDWFAE